MWASLTGGLFFMQYCELQHIFLEKGYRFYDKGSYNLNIFGIRSENSKSNKFDDHIGVAYRDHMYNPVCEVFPATTDPGKYYLQRPLHRDGTLILVPSQYKGAYMLGLHGRTSNSPYKALEQVGPMKYVRDNNKDITLDFDLYRDPKKYKKHFFEANPKTNIHRASKWKIVQLIEKYSAGCQVIQKNKDFDKLINLCEISMANLKYNKFTYTLLEEADL
jgi:hypothetical protein